VLEPHPQDPSVLQKKNLLHSTKQPELNRIRDIARCILAARQPLSETRLFELVGCPRYRADILRAMKQLRNYYPGKLRLVLIRAEWYLVPVLDGE
jgi:chromosome segregation and condensation protein ScpB